MKDISDVQLSHGQVTVGEPFELERFLAAERRKDLFRFATAGSVDDGKSTLIGRLLLDAGGVYDDQVRSVEGRGTAAPGVPDLALLTDGLRAEREAGITIDVAYRYFSTPRRKFILADTPGHEQYTRNMITGVSTADAVVVLVDASRGVLPQTRRHASIAALLRVRHLVLAVNKMDLVGFARQRFEEICAEFRDFFSGLPGHDAMGVHTVPVSALAGDGVVHASARMPWSGPHTLLELLETLPAARDREALAPFRMAVQRVVRTGAGFRGYAGQIAAGTVRPGDPVLVQPAGISSHIGRLVTAGGDLAQARAPMSVTVTLADELDLGRGDLLAAPNAPAAVGRELEAVLVWMDDAPLQIGRRYLLKHMARTVPVQVTAIVRQLALTGVASGSAAGLSRNEAAVASLELTQPVAADPFRVDRATGSFVLIDPESNATVAGGMIEGVGARPEPAGSVSARERQLRFGHRGELILLRGPEPAAGALERALFAAGANVILWDGSRETAEALVTAGLLVLMRSEGEGSEDAAAAIERLRGRGVLR